VLDGVQIGSNARLRRVIADRSTVIPPCSSIGYVTSDDRKQFHISPSGLVVLSAASIGSTAPMRHVSS
jgi:glucose-1-phosphate adenylyltransferase